MPKVVTLSHTGALAAVYTSNEVKESDSDIKERMRKKFKYLEMMTSATLSGDIRAMIVTGPPGVGKTYGVDKVLRKHELMNTLGQLKPKFEVVKGAISPVGLFVKLHEFRESKHLVVFDDCDGLFLEEESLNILKSALDSSKKRFISYNKDSRILKEHGVPNTFEFKGSAIFITNVTFGNIRSKKLRQHLEALESRSHFIDLKINSPREKVLRIEQVIEDGMLADMTEEETSEVVAYIKEHMFQMRELSLRMVLKVAGLRKAFPDLWDEMARETCMIN
jgi:hypothetical protein